MLICLSYGEETKEEEDYSRGEVMRGNKTAHDPRPRKALLEKLRGGHEGPEMKQSLNHKDLPRFRGGLSRPLGVGEVN